MGDFEALDGSYTTAASDSGLWSPDLYRDGPPHELLAHLRATDPVHWQDIPGQDGYWAVLRHADVVDVARQPELFSAEAGGVIVEDPTTEALESMRRMLLAMDPPRHGAFRRPVSPRFRARVIADLEPRVRQVCRAILAEAAEQGEVEFVSDVASKVPSRVFGEIMGLPGEDVAHLHRLAEQITSAQDPDFEYHPAPPAGQAGHASAAGQAGQADAGPAPAAAPMSPAMEMAMYAVGFAARRRAEAYPAADLTTLLLATEFSGAPMDEATFASFFVQLVTAGNDTTKTLLSAGLLRLVDHPEQLAELRSDRSRWPDAIEEMLRFDNPIHYFRRTATAPARIGGRDIAAGDKVAMIYTSANRDPAVFERPEVFDTTRRPNPHLSFGIAEHFCLGAHLARLEARVFFEELTAAFTAFEPVGTPVRVRSNLNNAFRRVPVRLVPGPARA